MAIKFTELTVVEGLRNNDSGALDFLFAEFFKPLQYFAERLTNDREESKDIVISIFQKFWNNRQNFESFPNIKAFFYIATRNECLNFIKYKKRNQEVKKSFQYLFSTDEIKAADRGVMEADLLYQVYLEVQNLPERSRQVFIMTYFKGMKANEIAEEMQISVSAVTSHRATAINHLKRVLSDEKFRILILILTGLSAEHHSLGTIL